MRTEVSLHYSSGFLGQRKRDRLLAGMRIARRDSRGVRVEHAYAQLQSSARLGRPRGLGAVCCSRCREQLPTPCAEAFWLFLASEVGVDGDQCTAPQSRWRCALQQEQRKNALDLFIIS